MSEALTDGPLRIERAIEAARDASRSAIAAYLTAGFPARGGFRRLIESVAEEADLLEIGVPFTDPMADGVTIQRASSAALEAGVTLAWILETLSAGGLRTPTLLMSYLNPLLAFGIERLAIAARNAGVAGFIVPDLPLEESERMRAACDGCGLALVQMVSPVTPDIRLEAICRSSRGFVYAVTTTGTTGGRVQAAQTVRGYLERVRRASRLPVLAGFGIRDARQVRALADCVDGVVIGSALVEALERGADPLDFLRGLRAGKGESAEDERS